MAISDSTRFRDAKRGTTDVEWLELSRRLRELGETYERFKPRINQLIYDVRLQICSPEEKQEMIRRALSREGELTIHELALHTRLELSSPQAGSVLVKALIPMVQSGEVEMCSRNGTRYVAPAGRATDSLGRPLGSAGQPDAAGVPLFFRLGPSQRSARSR